MNTQFFRDFLARWNRDNAKRSEDYILGGRVAIREMSEVAPSSAPRPASTGPTKEQRELQQRNKELNERLVAVTDKYEKQVTANEVLKVEIAHQKMQPEQVSHRGDSVSALQLKLAAALGESSSLRNRLKELSGHGKAGHDGVSMSVSGAISSLRQRIIDLEQQLGTYRAGPARFAPKQFLARMMKLLNSSESAGSKLTSIQELAENAQEIINGNTPAKPIRGLEGAGGSKRLWAQ